MKASDFHRGSPPSETPEQARVCLFCGAAQEGEGVGGWGGYD